MDCYGGWMGHFKWFLAEYVEGINSVRHQMAWHNENMKVDIASIAYITLPGEGICAN
jgi:hypothetical protein